MHYHSGVPAIAQYVKETFLVYGNTELETDCRD